MRFDLTKLVGVLVVAGALAGIVSPEVEATPGGWTQAQVNAAIANGVAYLDAQQNADGSYGFDDVAETGIALTAYGVLANGNFSSLPASYQTHVQNAINYVLANQGTSDGIPGAFSPGFYPTYSTGLALLGLSYFTSVNPAVPAAIASARSFLTSEFQGPAYTGCNSADGSPTAYYCGGWNYDPGQGRSDESNSGYAMTGLQVTGGIPASLVPDNINWNHHVQEIASNPFAARSDGGGDYEPGISFGGFSSNANDSGTVLFSLADDGVPMADPNAAAAITFDQDVLNAYELMQANVGTANMQMIAHSGATEDGSCTPNTAGCDWYTSGDGGYHYSLFALTKGLGGYISPNLSDPTNWYAKVVDLLLSQQGTDGSWPQDARDDFSTVFATGLAVSSLGLVAVPTATPTTLTVNAASGDFADATTVSAVLKNANTLAPIAGETVTLTLNGAETCSAVTDGTGTASCQITPGEAAATYTLAGTFGGNSTYAASSGSANFIVTHEETGLTYTGNTSAVNGSSMTLSAMLTTDDPSAGTPLAGKTVVFTLGSGGSAQTCSGTTNASGSASCTIASVSQTVGSVPIAASFAGDSYYQAASASSSADVFPPTTARGAFVIGDISAGSPTIGHAVYFWGSQWAKQNSLSGGSAPSAMKGFADSSTPNLTCGATFSTAPGDSSAPPPSLPSQIDVIVSSEVTKNGSTISGTITHIVVVQVNPGYGPTPGHRGTGTIIGTVC
jgi:hypothetical protein